MNDPISAFRRNVLLAGIAALLGSFIDSPAQAQAYPAKPVRMLVGYSAGGGVDAMARLLASRMSALLGQQVVVENRTGATSMIAADATRQSAPDGYTVMLADSALLIAPLLQKKSDLDPLKSFTPVAAVFSMPLMIVTGNDFPARTPNELVALIKANPGKYSYATSGVGTVHHLGFEMLKGQTQSSVVHVPYRGAAQIIPDVISGQVPIGVVSAAAGIAQAKGGKLRALALMSPAKLAGAEDVPALADALPGFDATPRLFVLAPAGTPAPIVEQLEGVVRTVMASPELAQTAALQGAVPAFMGSAPMVGDLARESAMWSSVIREQKISAE